LDNRTEKLRARFHHARSALQNEIEERRARFRYSVSGKRVEFQEDIRRTHRAARENLSDFLSRTRLLVVLTAPVIYSLIVPLVILDLFITTYQALCFPVYGIRKVRRADYIAIDRHMLQYLNGLQKLNCVYCGYGNGLLNFVREIAGRTEAYWCPIKHSRRVADTHEHYVGFADFGDAAGYQAHVEEQRRALSEHEE